MQTTHNVLNVSDQDIEQLRENVDAVYAYIDLFIDEMTKEEIEGWKDLLEKIDPDYYSENQEDDK